MVGAVARPIRTPKPNRKPIASCSEREATTFRPSNRPKLAMKRTKPQPCERSRPRYAPTANRPAVTATSPIVWPNRARAWSRATAGWSDVSKELTDSTLLRRRASELAARDLTALDARDLLRGERRL